MTPSIAALKTRLEAYIPASRLMTDEPMARHTTFRIGGPADLMLSAASGNEIIAARRDADALGVQTLVLGNGSNTLARDGGVRGLVILIGEHMSDISFDGPVVTAGAGASLTRLCREAMERGLDGLVPLSGIPGSVGGAVAMNAGAYGGQISDTLSEALVVDGGEARRMAASELALGYRDSIVLRRGLVVAAARFVLRPGDKTAMTEAANELAQRRRDKQPLTLPSAGSVFKRPEGHFAGALIEAAGLKGFSIGGAQVSEKHAGFIVNTGGATAGDVLALIRYIQDRVFERDGVRLEPEVRVVGED